MLPVSVRLQHFSGAGSVFNINMWAGIVDDRLVGHIGLQTTTTETSSDMICESY
jgi:hypothetical protein